uniref:C-type mannose receptor 2-like n=1 Tax=Epinephelus lanceolatus TaxID=310571 RepID=UPI001445D762|nr:C-type mannose receptor 2-like [Epinephelus lanceolatus]
MQWSLFLLLLMGQCSFFMCHLHEYHFVEEEKNWTEAQQYCREHHTDLATVSNMTDMERLRDSAQNQDGAWIGLYSDPERNERGMWHWQWSLPGLESRYRESRWHKGQPNNYRSTNEKCVLMDNHKWKDVRCCSYHKCICYDERKQSNKTFHLIEDKMSWPQAQSYCREHHTDLVSGDQQLEDNEFKREYKSNKYVWIGLFRDSWRWSDGSSFSFRYRGPQFNDDSGSERCAVTMLNDGGRWRDEHCDEKKPFFCYGERDLRGRLISLQRELSNPDEQRWVQEKAKKANSPYVWLGLRYTCTLGFWFWVNEEMVTYKNWVTGVPADDCDMSGAMDRGGEHKWFKKNDNEKFNFICSTC